jgi:hypothetical protein
VEIKLTSCIASLGCAALNAVLDGTLEVGRVSKEQRGVQTHHHNTRGGHSLGVLVNIPKEATEKENTKAINWSEGAI